MSVKCFKDNGASPELIKRYEELLASGMSEAEAGRSLVLNRTAELATQLNNLRAELTLPAAAIKVVTPQSLYKEIVDNRDQMTGAMKVMVSDDFNQDVLDFFINGALDNRAESEKMFGIKGKEITDKLLTLANESQKKAAVVEKPVVAPASPFVMERNVPEPLADFEVTRVIPYTDPSANKFKPSQQLKFNQGTKHEPVRVVGHSALIELISIGAKQKSKYSGKKVTIDEVRRKELEKMFNMSAVEAHNRATRLARENRNENIERIILIGKNDGTAKTEPTDTETNDQGTISETKTTDGITVRFDFGRAPKEGSNVGKKVNTKAMKAPKEVTPPPAKPIIRKAPRLTVPGNETPSSNHEEIFNLVKAAFPTQLNNVDMADFMNTSGFRSDDGKYYYLGNDKYLNLNQRFLIPKDLIFVSKESIDNKLDELNNSCNS